jgi:cation diffusion facilitator family transporter
LSCPADDGRLSLTRFAGLSIAAALATMALKLGAWQVTGSVGLLSDALESLINLAAALMALGVLVVAARPPDEGHQFGHEKAEFFASGAEGVLILVASAAIAVPAWNRLQAPQPIEEIGLGLGISVLAALLNLGVARILGGAGRQYRSAVLEADAQHLMTDVWTSAGVVAGVAAVAWTGWLVLDPLIALLVAAHILYTGADLIRKAVHGLMDPALPLEERQALEAVLDRTLPEGTQYHALLTRQAGPRRFASVHILVPGRWTVQKGHHLLEEVEEAMRAALPGLVLVTHLEPVEDPVSFADQEVFSHHVPEGA